MFENGSFLRRRKRFKLQKIDKEFLQKTLGSSFSSSPQPIASPNNATTSPPSSLGSGGPIVPNMAMSPPIPGMIPNSAFMSSGFSHHHHHHPHSNPQFGGLPPFNPNGPQHPMFLNAGATDARLLAAAAAAGYPREMYASQPHHHHHHHPHFHSSSGAPGGPAGHLPPGHPGLHLGMTPKDFDDIREATRAIKSLREVSSKSHHHHRSSKVVDSSSDLSSSVANNNINNNKSHSDNSSPHNLKSQPNKSHSLNTVFSKSPKGRRGGNNSNNFSIENLIAKDKETLVVDDLNEDEGDDSSQEDSKQTRHKNLITNGSSSGKDHEDENNCCSEDEDVVMDDDDEDNPSESGSVLSVTSEVMEERLTTTTTHTDLENLDDLSNNDSPRSSPSLSPKSCSPISPNIHNNNNNNSPLTGKRSGVSHSPSNLKKGLLHSPSSKCSSPPKLANKEVDRSSSHESAFIPNSVAVSAASLLPAYPFYAAAFLSAQSILYNQQQYFNAANGNGNGGGNGPNSNSNHPHHLHNNHHHQFQLAAAAAAASGGGNGGNTLNPAALNGHYGGLGGHPGLNPAAAMLFSGKNLSGL